MNAKERKGNFCWQCRHAWKNIYSGKVYCEPHSENVSEDFVRYERITCDQLNPAGECPDFEPKNRKSLWRRIFG